MYFADMYAYGKDPKCAGITGISGCMGVIIDYGSMLYAPHFPTAATLSLSEAAVPSRTTSGRKPELLTA